MDALQDQDVQAPAASSVEDKCPICLDDFQDKAFITVCFHAFCFDCVVMAASMTGNVCPLCKVKYFKVIHNVRGNDDYELHRISRFQKSSKFQSLEGSGTSSSHASK